MTMRRLAHRPAHVAALLLLALLVVAPIFTQSVAGQEKGPSANAQVIAQGLTAPPAENSAWRVVQQKIPTRLDAVPSVRLQSSVGFLLSDDVDIFVVDQRTKLRSRLAPGQAQFVQTGANQTWASLATKAGTAYTLELVDRDVAKVAPGGEVIYTSGSFTTPLGDYDLDLIRSEVAAGDKATIPASSYPMLILVTSGSATITSAKHDDPIRLKAGQASVAKGDITIKPRGDKPVTFVAAVLGDPITGGDDVPTVAP
ncbi:MAG TPA: hypothetical protein PK819_12620, partial [Thermomicrobiales bacterium]|nr:hypothetical protein [Thermomicrobiales bacterium]